MPSLPKRHGQELRSSWTAAGRNSPDLETAMPSSTMSTKKLKMHRTSWLLWIAVILVTLLVYGSQACILQEKSHEGEDKPDLPYIAELRSPKAWKQLKLSEIEAVSTLGRRGRDDMLAKLYPARLPPRLGIADDTVRCRTSDICEPDTKCHAGKDRLGCVLDMEKRREHLVSAVQWAWKGYRRCSWGMDELLPISCKGHDWFGLGLTLVDSLDTLILAGMHKEADEAVKWIKDKMVVTGKPGERANLFEATIRIVGGLLSAAHLRGGGDELLKPAVEIAVRLLSAFNTRSGVPLSDVNLAEAVGQHPAWTTASSLSEVSTLSMEFCHVARAASYPAMAQPALDVWDALRSTPGTEQGLAPMLIDPGDTGNSSLNAPDYDRVQAHFATRHITLGARSDSYYEYMLKQYIMGGKRDQKLLQMYMEAMRGVKDLLLDDVVYVVSSGGLMYVGERTAGKQGVPSKKMDHLVCFLPGLLALGHFHGIETATRGQISDMELAENLMHTCYEMYRQTPTGLAAEITIFLGPEGDFPKAHTEDIGGGNFMIKEADAHNLLRPETVESLFILSRVTGDEKYAEWGWQIFRAFEMYTRYDKGGYTNLRSVLHLPPERSDKMESFFIAETLKYLLLLFSPTDVVPLNEYVFNTEAHPLPILDSPLEQAHRQWYLPPPRHVNETLRLDTPSLVQLIADLKDAWKH